MPFKLLLKGHNKYTLKKIDKNKHIKQILNTKIYLIIFVRIKTAKNHIIAFFKYYLKIFIIKINIKRQFLIY